MGLQGYKVIDADGHVFDTLNIDWEKEISPQYKHIAPMKVPLGNGSTKLLVEGQLWGRLFPSDDKPQAVDYTKLHKSREGMHNPKVRLQHLDMDGIDTAVLFGGAMMVGASSLQNAGLAADISRVYNDWAFHFCQADPQRLKGVASVAYQDPKLGGKEMDRAVRELGFVGVGIPTNINGMGLDNPFFFPLYADAQALGVPLCIGHGMGVAPGIPAIGEERVVDKYVIHVINFPLEHMLGIALLISSGIFDKFPRLKFAFLEGWVSWLPFWIERLEEYVESYASHAEMKARPKEYLRGPQFYIGCEPGEGGLAHAVEAVGEDRIMYASDYFHFDAKFPGSVKKVLDNKGLSESAKRKLLYDNASRLYKVEVR